MSLGLLFKYVKRRLKPYWVVPDTVVKKPSLDEYMATSRLFNKDVHKDMFSKLRIVNGIEVGISINEVYTFRILRKYGFLNSPDLENKRDLTYNLINDYGIDYAEGFWCGYSNF